MLLPFLKNPSYKCITHSRSYFGDHSVQLLFCLVFAELGIYSIKPAKIYMHNLHVPCRKMMIFRCYKKIRPLYIMHFAKTKIYFTQIKNFLSLNIIMNKKNDKRQVL